MFEGREEIYNKRNQKELKPLTSKSKKSQSKTNINFNNKNDMGGNLANRFLHRELLGMHLDDVLSPLTVLDEAQ